MNKTNEHQGPQKEYVANMFNKIAHKYDFLNHFLSAGIDYYWRHRAKNRLKITSNSIILDSATGTGDMAISLAKEKPAKVIGIDISEEMLNVARMKIDKKQLSDKIELIKVESEIIPINENTIDCITIAFGIRNFESPQIGLNEFHRVLKNGGKLVVLELTHPQKFPFKKLYTIYSDLIMPKVGKLISGDSSAYKYLPKSVKRFPEGVAFINLMENAEFREIKMTKLTFGIVTIYEGVK